MLDALILGLHLGTYHHNDQNLNDVNPGIYARTENGFTAGGYYNSYRKPTVYVGWTFETPDKRFALTVVGATGYPQAPVRLGVIPSVKLGAARVWLIPAEHPAIHLSVEF